MIRAYHETYLNNAMTAMAEAFDYAVNDCNIDGESFVKMFIASPICSRMENGEPAYLRGKSGIEIVRECVYATTGKSIEIEPSGHFSRSPEYWGGWAIAYYQWYSDRKYVDIFKAICFDDLLCMYPTLHEADITKFVEVVEERMREAFPDTNLKRIRMLYGCSQSELAELSGVSLRSIQMYEQRQKDINKASVTTVSKLAKALGCSVEDLIEK